MLRALADIRNSEYHSVHVELHKELNEASPDTHRLAGHFSRNQEVLLENRRYALYTLNLDRYVDILETKINILQT